MPSKASNKEFSRPASVWQQDGLDFESEDAASLHLHDDDDEEEEDSDGNVLQGTSRPRYEVEGSGSSSEVSFTDDDEDEEQSEDEETVIRKRIASVPFGTLAKAQRTLEGESDSEADEFQDERERKRAHVRALLKAQKGAKQSSEGLDGRGKRMSAKEREGKGRDQGWGGKVAAQRDDKHAPMEMSSRKPVSRKRQVIETAAVRRRDPRFSSLSASTPNSGIFESSYGFVRSQQTSELKDLKATFVALRKQEAHHAGPRARSEQALAIRAERERVEAALRRVEGLENERRKREHETSVMRRHKAEQKERVQQGGKAFYLKDSAKKALILQDKFERLSGTRAADGTLKEGSSGSGGSRQALRKALERRRKKNAQKERRDMPTMGAREASGMAPVPVPKRKRLTGGEAGGTGGGHKRGKRSKAE